MKNALRLFPPPLSLVPLLLWLTVLLVDASPVLAAAGQSGCCRIPSIGCRTVTEGACESLRKPTEGKEWSCGQRCTRSGGCEDDPAPTRSYCVNAAGKRGNACETDANCPAGSTCTPFPLTPVEKMAWDEPLVKAACCACETLPPTCVRTATRSGPPAQIDIEVQDAGSGLLFVDVLVQDNASVPAPSFTIGSTAPLTITATKIDQSLAARVELEVTDVAGNSTRCDPILTEVIRSAGKPQAQTYSRLSDTESWVEIFNGSPGLVSLEVVVNGRRFRVGGLRDDETRVLDVSPAMLPGNENIFTLRSSGRPGASATVLIGEPPPSPGGRTRF